VNDEEFCIDECTSQENFFQKLIQKCYSKLENIQEQFHEIELKNLLHNKPNSQSKRMLAAGTVECWSAADQMFKLKFPGLVSAPFQPKYLQGTELKIYKTDHSSFEVVQQKKCHIYLRSNPTESSSFSIQGEPLCTLTLNWTVQSKEEHKNVFNETGTLKIIGIEFAEGIFSYEKNEILASLKNLKTATNRQFPEF